MSDSHNKVAILLVPGFHSSSLSCGIWNQLEVRQQGNIESEIRDYNVITDDSLQKDQYKSLHIYEINWSSYIGHTETSINPFYQAYLTFILLWNLLWNLVYSIGNLLKFIGNYLWNFICNLLCCNNSLCQLQEYLDYKPYVCSAFTTPSSLVYFVFFPISSLYILIINLFVIFSVLYDFVENIKFTDQTTNTIIDLELKTIIMNFIQSFFEFSNRLYGLLQSIIDLSKFILNDLVINLLNILLNMIPDNLYSSFLPGSLKAKLCLTQTSVICQIPDESIKNSLIIIFIFLWIVGVARSREINRILEFYVFINNYCTKELLRIKIRLNLLKKLNSILLDTNNYKDIVIISLMKLSLKFILKSSNENYLLIEKPPLAIKKAVTIL